MLSNNPEDTGIEADNSYLYPSTSTYNFTPRRQVVTNFDTTDIPVENIDTGEAPGILDRFSRGYSNQRKYDELIGKSDSAKQLIRGFGNNTNTALKSLGITPIDLYRDNTGRLLLPGDPKQLEWLDTNIENIKAGLTPEEASRITSVKDFLQGTKIRAEDLEKTIEEEEGVGFFSKLNEYYISNPGTSLTQAFAYAYSNTNVAGKLGHLTGAAVTGLTDPLVLAANVASFVIPGGKVAQLVGGAVLGAAADTGIANYYLNPARKLIDLQQLDLKDVFTGSLEANLLLSGGLHLVEAGISKAVKAGKGRGLEAATERVEKLTTAERANNMLAAEIEHTKLEGEGNGFQNFADRIGRGEDFDAAAEELNGVDFTSLFESHQEYLNDISETTTTKTGTTEKRSIFKKEMEDYDATGYLRTSSERATAQLLDYTSRRPRGIETRAALINKWGFTEAEIKRGGDAGSATTGGSAATGGSVATDVAERLADSDQGRQKALNWIRGFDETKTYETFLHREISKGILNSKTPEAASIDYLNVTQGNRTAIHGDLTSIFETSMSNELDGIKWETTENLQSIDQDLVKEIFNQSTDNKVAKALAKSWKKITDEINYRYELCGVTIKKLPNYFQQSHNQRLIMQAGTDKWYKDTSARLDWRKTAEVALEKNPESNIADLPVNAEKQRKFLESVYDNITRHGVEAADEVLRAIDRGETITSEYPATLGQRVQASRVLFFKDAESFSSYNELYGNHESLVENIQSYMSKASKDLAVIQQFGENPRETIKIIKQKMTEAVMATAPKEGKKAYNLVEKAKKAAISTGKILDNMYEIIAGNLHVGDTNIVEKVIHDFSNVRITAALADVGLLSYITNTAFTLVSGSRIGLGYISMLKDYLAVLGGLPKAKLKELGVILDLDNASNQRFDPAYGTTTGKKIANFGRKITGFRWADNHGKSVFQKQFMSNVLAANKNKTFAEVIKDNIGLEKTFRENGITSADWDIIRKIKPIEWKGVEFISPKKIYSDLQDRLPTIEERNAANKLSKLILQEQEHFIPGGSIRGSAQFNRSSIAGKYTRAVVDSAFMFSNFPATMWYNLQRRWLNEPANFGKLAIGGLLLGSGYVALKDMLDGKVPQFDKKFLGRSLQYSGLVPYEAGILIDGLTKSYQEKDPFGFFGEAPKRLGKIALETYKYYDSNGRKGSPPKEIIGLTKSLIPRMAGVRLLTDRLLFDPLQNHFDPEANKFKRNLRKQEKEQPRWMKRSSILY